MVTPTPPDPRREALPVRMAFVEVERALEHVATADEAAAAAAAAGEVPPAEAVAESQEQQGLMLFRLAVVSFPGCRACGGWHLPSPDPAACGERVHFVSGGRRGSTR